MLHEVYKSIYESAYMYTYSAWHTPKLQITIPSGSPPLGGLYELHKCQLCYFKQKTKKVDFFQFLCEYHSLPLQVLAMNCILICAIVGIAGAPS